MHTWICLFFLLLFIKPVVCQDCDSFQCLKGLHQDLTYVNSSRNSLCSATQTYVYCLRKSTVICTSLTIHDMTEVATLLMSHAKCSAAPTTMATSSTTFTPLLLVSMLFLLR